MSLPDGAGGTFALPSPTHAHQLDVSSAVRSLRRSISRSPSRFLSRATSRHTDGSTPASPQSPCRRFRLTPQRHHDHLSPSPHVQSAPPVAVFAHGSTTPQGSSFTPLRPARLSLRSAKSSRTASPSRPITRSRASPKSPLRRALNATVDQGNVAAQHSAALYTLTSGTSMGQENRSIPTSPAQSEPRSANKPSRHSLHLDVSGSSAQAFLKALDAKNDSATSNAGGLKRNDAMMNLDQPYQGSPVPKRRSMYGSAPLEQGNGDRSISASDSAITNDFKIHEDSHRGPDLIDITGSEAPLEFQGAPPTPLGPPKRSSSLRKSTMMPPRLGENRSLGRRTGQRHLAQLAQMDSESTLTPVKGRAPLGGIQFEPPSSGGLFGSTTPTSNPPLQLGDTRNIQTHHPLAQTQTLSTSSSGNSFTEETAVFAPPPLPAKFNAHAFSRSLPLGADRPTGAYNILTESTPSQGNILYQGTFGSTGLISKVNKNPEQTEKKLVPPDTPCKPWRKPSDRFNTYPIGGTPSTAKKSRGNNRNSFAGMSSLTFQPPTETPRFGSSIFDLRKSHISAPIEQDFDGDATLFDDIKEDVMPKNSLAPPTPTRNGLTPSFSNLSNLSEYSEQGSEESFDSPSANRKSLGPRDGLPLSAARPAPLRQPNFGSANPLRSRRSSKAPQELFLPENPGALPASRPSIFGGLGDSNMLPPATPTTERDFRSSTDTFSTPVHDDATFGFGDDNMEPTLQKKFDDVTKIGDGEFSIVYRVKERGQPFSFSISPDSNAGEGFRTPATDRVFVVKKSKRPYMGNKDRDRKIKEARILQALTEAEHVVQYIDDWEANDCLYIQTEYCENGTLKDFYTREGFFGRLDDFCIFKILLDLTLGLKEIHDAGFMHLDMKPANIFVTFEGALKIGDFGLARAQTDTGSLDTEGDREYMAPEMLQGMFGCSSDIFSLGLIVLEAIANVEIPGNGDDWRKLRADDFSGVPSLAWTASCDTNPHRSGLYNEEYGVDRTHDAGDLFGSHKRSELMEPPAFMEDAMNPESLRSVVGWMMASNRFERPTADQLLALSSLQWIAQRRSAPATIFEGRWGPIESEPLTVVDVVDTEMTGV